MRYFGRFVLFISLVISWVVIDYFFGQKEAIQFWGIGLLSVSISFIFLTKLPVGIRGKVASFYLTGWSKAFVIIPGMVLGLSLTFYPHDVACFIELRGYVC